MEQELADKVHEAARVLQSAAREAQRAGLVVSIEALTTPVIGGDHFETIIVQVLQPLAPTGKKAGMVVEL